MNAMDGTNRRSRAVGKAAVAHKRLQRHRGQNARGDYASNQIFEDDSPFNLTKNLARGPAPEVRVNAVAPGFVDTQWKRSWPKETRQGAADRAVLERFCTPQDIADVIVFLCPCAPALIPTATT